MGNYIEESPLHRDMKTFPILARKWECKFIEPPLSRLACYPFGDKKVCAYGFLHMDFCIPLYKFSGKYFLFNLPEVEVVV